jgi:predicted secreted hydrolase
MLKMFRTVVIGIGTLFMSAAALANLPYYPIEFPRDDAGHYANTPYPVSNMMEWWYYNGILTSEDGRQFGYYVSFNYIYQAPNIIVPFLQFQLVDASTKKIYNKQLFFSKKDGFHIATDGPMYVSFGKDLTLQKKGNQYVLSGFIETDQNIPLRLSLTFTPTRPVLLIGETGLVDMWNGKNSYYYSFTRLETSGYVQLDHQMFQLDPAKSLSWMDHQWGDFLTVPGKTQWLWTSVQLKNGLEMNFGVVMDPKTKQTHGGATILMPDGSKKIISDLSKLSYVPHEIEPGQKHPSKYDISVADLDLKLTLDALAPGQDKNGIWEGMSTITGTYQGKPITGQGISENMMK